MALTAEQVAEVVSGSQNQESIEKAKELLRDHGCILFSGAGTSKGTGYPLWEELLDRLCTVLTTAHGVEAPVSTAGENPLVRAQKIYDAFEANDLLQPYHALLLSTFSSKKTPDLDLQTTLLDLDVRGIATTNFDPCFEEALVARNETTRNHGLRVHEDCKQEVREFFDSIRMGKTPRQVLHLHGVHNLPKSCILTARQFEKEYGFAAALPSSNASAINSTAWSLLRKTLWSLVATQRVLFVGFSMTDPTITAMLEYISIDLWDNARPVHVLITDISTDSKTDPAKFRAKLLQKMGIEVIFYEAKGGDHGQLFHVLEQLGAKRGSARGRAPSIDELNKIFDPK